MRLVFRADASLAIGSGHAMRCSAIAEEAISRGIECLFVGSLGDIKWLAERFEMINFQTISCEIFKNPRFGDVLILDSYTIQNDDSFVSNRLWKKRVDIVDEKTPKRNSDLFIHTGLGTEWFGGDYAKLLFGPLYVPLRKSIKKNLARESSKVRKIVVFGGGTDGHGFGIAMGVELTRINGFDKAIFFSDHKVAIEKLDSRFKVISFGQELDGELIDADLVFTTASTSSLEVVARELPLGVACSVDNQIPYYEALSAAKVAIQVGERVKLGAWRMNFDEIYKLIHDSKFRYELRCTTTGFIDLFGAKRIIDAITEL